MAHWVEMIGIYHMDIPDMGIVDPVVGFGFDSCGIFLQILLYHEILYQSAASAANYDIGRQQFDLLESKTEVYFTQS